MGFLRQKHNLFQNKNNRPCHYSSMRHNCKLDIVRPTINSSSKSSSGGTQLNKWWQIAADLARALQRVQNGALKREDKRKKPGENREICFQNQISYGVFCYATGRQDSQNIRSHRVKKSYFCVPGDKILGVGSRGSGRKIQGNPKIMEISFFSLQ
jgi:hypothetical protein